MLAGMSALVVGALVGDELGSHAWEVGITMAGSTVMVSAHWLNRTFCRLCSTCESEQ
jgi:hypothetical protein